RECATSRLVSAITAFRRSISRRVSEIREDTVSSTGSASLHGNKVRDPAHRIRERLKALEHERMRLEARLREIEDRQEQPKIQCPPLPSTVLIVTNSSPAADKVGLFRGLFAARTDVFAARWENPKSGRSGYAPACANEWVRGVCGKPQVRCGECPNQSF